MTALKRLWTVARREPLSAFVVVLICGFLAFNVACDVFGVERYSLAVRLQISAAWMPRFDFGNN